MTDHRIDMLLLAITVPPAPPSSSASSAASCGPTTTSSSSSSATSCGRTARTPSPSKSYLSAHADRRRHHHPLHRGPALRAHRGACLDQQRPQQPGLADHPPPPRLRHLLLRPHQHLQTHTPRHYAKGRLSGQSERPQLILLFPQTPLPPNLPSPSPPFPLLIPPSLWLLPCPWKIILK